MTASASPRVAVVVIAHGRHKHLRAQHASLDGQPLDQHIVVAMDDPDLRPLAAASLPADPLGLPLAAARNLGAATAIAAGAEVLVFLDVDCVAGPGLVAAYAAAVTAQPDVVWSGPVTYLPEGAPLDDLSALDAPHPARPDPGRGARLLDVDPDLFWSLSFAVSASTWEAVGGFCEDYVGYGGEDTDFGHSVVDRGFRHGVAGDARAYHQWHPVSSPPVEHLDDILRNGATFASRWGRWPMQGWLLAFEARGLVCRVGSGWERL